MLKPLLAWKATVAFTQPSIILLPALMRDPQSPLRETVAENVERWTLCGEGKFIFSLITFFLLSEVLAYY